MLVRKKRTLSSAVDRMANKTKIFYKKQEDTGCALKVEF